MQIRPLILNLKSSTIFSKSKMQTAIESVTGIGKNNLSATESNWMYKDPADYTLVLFKYLATKIKKQTH